MKFRSIRYYMQEAFISLFRNQLMTLASIVTVVSCVFMVSFSYCIASNIDYMLQQLEDSLSLSVFLRDDIEASDVDVINKEIKKIPNVKSVKYISAEDALKDFSEVLGESGTAVLAGLENYNPLPRSFVVSLEDAKHQDEVVKAIEKLSSKGVDYVRYEKEIINIITTVNTGIRIISIVVILCLLVISVVIIMNTVKLTVNSRKTEIIIMKYIGATDWFIRWPFIIEGVLIGIIGAIIPVGLCWIGYSSSLDAVYNNFKMLRNLVVFRSGWEIFVVLVPVALVIGIGIGTIGSVTSMRKYLKV